MINLSQIDPGYFAMQTQQATTSSNSRTKLKNYSLNVFEMTNKTKWHQQPVFNLLIASTP